MKAGKVILFIALALIGVLFIFPLFRRSTLNGGQYPTDPNLPYFPTGNQTGNIITGILGALTAGYKAVTGSWGFWNTGNSQAPVNDTNPGGGSWWNGQYQGE